MRNVGQGFHVIIGDILTAVLIELGAKLFENPFCYIHRVWERIFKKSQPKFWRNSRHNFLKILIGFFSEAQAGFSE